MSAEQEKRVRKKPVKFQVWQEGDKHAPNAVRNKESRKKQAQKERNKKCQEKKNHLKQMKKMEDEQKKRNGEKGNGGMSVMKKK